MHVKTINVAAAVIENDGKYLATQRGYGEFKDWWEFPGGKSEPKEAPADTVRREIKEELNADIRVEKLLCTIDYDYPDFHLQMHCFLCRFQNDDYYCLLEAEDAKWLSPEELNTVKWLPADTLAVNALIDFLRTTEK